MSKKISAILIALLMIISDICPVLAAEVPQKETPDYKVSFFYYDCFNMQDADGKRSGYGYEMMQKIAGYMQCTFSYVGYDKSAKESEEMLRNGEIDIYTAGKKTEEREEEFIFSKHPSVTATTCMTVRLGNDKVVAGDYSTYDGLKIGLLSRHTYNGRFEDFAKQKGFTCEISYYETPAELTNALITGEVDALVNSYISTPEDERVVEKLEETPYYLMARKEDTALMDQIDAALDRMNMETPTWRTDLYNRYYGTAEDNREFTAQEQELLEKLQADNTVIRAVMNPDQNPYSWYEDGEAQGIVADIFKATAESLELGYEIIEVKDRAEYRELIGNGSVDVWMDIDCYYEDEKDYKYKITNPYLTTTVSTVRKRDAQGRIKRLAIADENIPIRKIVQTIWPEAEIVQMESLEECTEAVLSGEVDGALLMTYTAQKLSQRDVRNRLRVNIVPGASLELYMGVNSKDDYLFYGLWDKALREVAEQNGAEIVQTYLEQTSTPTVIGYLYSHPGMMLILLGSVILTMFFVILYLLQVKSRKRQQKISAELAAALETAREANESKQNFFSKMSHDIRTPLNVVLGMTQIAQKYKHDSVRLDNALDNITSEGNYLLMLINSILDVNQLEHGHMELAEEPFDIGECMKSTTSLLEPLAQKKDQSFTVSCQVDGDVVIGDRSRYSQIIINIISNAVKYTDGGGHIEVGLCKTEEGRYQFFCKDDGIGMSEEFIQHICEEYTRAEDSRISKTEGTGLGMAVVKGFTELMHGTLQVKSKLGEGSCFIVEIPFQEASKEQKEALQNANAEDEERFKTFNGKRVLLVEDNELNAEIARELLEMIGLSVDWAENGKVGTERFEQSEEGYYMAIFMDMQMPVMDGVEATRLIRASNRRDHGIPVFALTANTFASDREKCKNAGMTGYISKPIHIRDIETALNECAAEAK